MVIDFFVSMGMVIGGALLGGIAAAATHHPPMKMMVNLADQLKIWALVSALGGTMDTLRVIEAGVLDLKLGPMLKQFSYLSAAFVGCQVGFLIIRWFAESEIK
jgi:hypothetical protein